MKKKLTYSDKLKDPRWQKKRLEIMDRDSFCCQRCNREDKTLHVHHKKYEPGKDPWEIDSKYLLTLCEECHEYETKWFEAYLSDLNDKIRQHLTADGVWSLLHAFGNKNWEYSPDAYAEAANAMVHSDYAEEIIMQLGKGWNYMCEDRPSKP